MSDAINPKIDIDRVKVKQRSKSEAKQSAMSLIWGETETITTVSHEPMLVDINELVPYSNHPFKLYEGERLSDMVRSIKELGILLPIIIRPFEDGCKANPIDTWNTPTAILYGSNDDVCEFDTISLFAKRFKCDLEIMDKGEHYFHTEEQLKYFVKWIKKHMDSK